MIREVAPELPARRARYSALIKGEVTEAFANLVELDQDLADAGESRQYIDLIWGAVLTRYLTLAKFGGFGNVRSAGRVQTPTLALVVERERERMAFVPEDYWQLTRYLTLAKFGGFGNVRSAGRVQTPTLALVVERERERMAFVPEDYWQIRGLGEASNQEFKIAHTTARRVQTPTLALVVERERERMAFVPEDYWQIRGLGEASNQEFKIAHTTARFTDKAAAEAAYAHVEGATTGTVTAVAKRSRKQQPPVPFNTTALQAAAAAEGISPARTMRIAESLYMSGFISYPRVDNTVYPKTLDIEGIVKGLASGTPALAPVCKKILAGPLTPTRGKVETTDHPPIHPTGQGDPTTLDGGQLKLYNLIARRFLATLMGPATIENTKLSIDVGGEPFAASGDVLVEAGFREAYPYGLKRDEQLPALAEGDVIDVRDIKLEAKQTEPPARYSQGKLVQEMEKRGLGTKSTRASIIERLYAVRYLKNDPIEPSQLGIAIIDALSEFAPRVTTPDMTAELDADMTKVAEGADTQEHVVDHSRALLAGMLDALIEHKDDLGEAISDAVTADARVGACPTDTQEHVVDHSRALLAGMLDALIEHKDDLGEAISDAVTADARVGACPTCGKDLVMKTSAKTRGSFIGCMGWPDCDVTYPVPSGVKVSPLEGEAAVCPECGAPRIKCQPFRQKAYEQCVNPKCPTNYEPDLKKVSPLEGEAAVCPECGAPRIKCQPFRQKAYEQCVNPKCPTNYEPDLKVGECSVCAEAGRHGDLIAHKSEKSGKRFIRCTNYDDCGVSYPLPASVAPTTTTAV